MNCPECGKEHKDQKSAQHCMYPHKWEYVMWCAMVGDEISMPSERQRMAEYFETLPEGKARKI